MLTGAPAAGSFQPIDFDASIVRLNASTELMSGLNAPFRTNNPTPVLARSVRVPATTLPSFSRLSICGPRHNHHVGHFAFLNAVRHFTDRAVVDAHSMARCPFQIEE